MKRMFGYSMFILTAVAMVALITVTLPQAAQAKVEVGDTPKIEFTAMDGTKVNSKFLKGKLVVVDFWATWCGPCVAAMPHMKKIHEQYADDGVQILGISLDRSAEPLEKFVKDRALPWPQYLDKSGMAQKWGVRGIPNIFIISPAGEVLWNGHPARMDAPLKKAIKEHLGEDVADNDAPADDAEAAQPAEASAEQIQQANDAIASAGEAIDQGDMHAMLSALETAPMAALTNDEVKAQAKSLIEKLVAQPQHREALKTAMAENRQGAQAFSNMVRAVATRPAAPQNAGPVKVGDSPTFSFTTLEGEKVSNETLEGKLVVMDFWATWCGPCMRAMPHMVELNKKYADQGVQVIGISLDRDKDALQRVIKEKELAWMHTHDTSRAMSKQFGVRGIPRIFILSPQGQVLWSGHPNSMDEPFKKALKEHPPEAEQTS